jgi:hypothetical protein
LRGVSGTEEASNQSRLKHWRQARAWFQRALDTLAAVHDSRILPEKDQKVKDWLQEALERCDAALKRLPPDRPDMQETPGRAS